MAVEARDLPHYTYRDYERWEGRWELIYGIPYAMSPQPSIRHQEVNGLLHAVLLEALRTCSACRPLLPVDWKIADDVVVQPDNLVVFRSVSGQYLTVPPALIFEILSPSTAHKDRNLKYRLYEQQQVRYYVMIDPDADEVEVYALEEGRYAGPRRVRRETVSFDLGACEIDLSVARIWG